MYEGRERPLFGTTSVMFCSRLDKLKTLQDPSIILRNISRSQRYHGCSVVKRSFHDNKNREQHFIVHYRCALLF